MRTPTICLSREIGLEAMRGLADSEPKELELLLDSTSGDEEALFMLSLTFSHPERKEEIFQQMRRFKPHVKKPRNLRNHLVTILEPVATALLYESTEVQAQTWRKRIPELQASIEETIGFFRPAMIPTEVVIVPADKIVTEQSGMSFVVGGKVLIVSHSTNPTNPLHEFLHSIINPIVYDKLGKSLSEDQEEQIIIMADGWLKDYGEYPLSLLAEALIRVYNDAVRSRKRFRHSNPLCDMVTRLYAAYEQEKSTTFQAFLLSRANELLSP